MSDNASATLARRNIQAALSFRGKSSFETSTALGRNRTYLDDYIKGRKDSISDLFQRKLSEHLNVHKSYITGEREWVDGEIISARGVDGSLASLEAMATRLREQILSLEQKKKSGRPFEEEELSDAIERLAQFEETIIMLKTPTYKITDKTVKQLLSDHSWSIPVSYAREVLNTLGSNIAVYSISDNSMRDASGNGFLAGDRVFADMSKTDARNGGIFVITQPDGVIVRAVDPFAEGQENRFVCRALNSMYPTFQASADGSSKIIGRVVAYVRPV